MALTLPKSDMGFASTASPPTTPITQPPFWDFRPTFNPKTWSSGTTSVNFIHLHFRQRRSQRTDPYSGPDLVTIDRCNHTLFKPRDGRHATAPVRRRKPPVACGARGPRGCCATPVGLRRVHGHVPR